MELTHAKVVVAVRFKMNQINEADISIGNVAFVLKGDKAMMIFERELNKAAAKVLLRTRASNSYKNAEGVTCIDNITMFHRTVFACAQTAIDNVYVRKNTK